MNPESRADGLLLCAWCSEFVDPGCSDDYSRRYEGGNFVAHNACAFRMVAGSVNHLLKRCSCFGGTFDHDPPELSLREAARFAFDMWRELNPEL